MTAASAWSMPRTAKLTSSADFRRTYAEGFRSAAGAVVAHVRRTEAEDSPRLGVTTVKGFGGAVARNRARRRLREAARSIATPLRSGVDVILVATPSVRSLSFQELVTKVEDALRRSGAFRD